MLCIVTVRLHENHPDELQCFNGLQLGVISGRATAHMTLSVFREVAIIMKIKVSRGEQRIVMSILHRPTAYLYLSQLWLLFYCDEPQKNKSNSPLIYASQHISSRTLQTSELPFLCNWYWSIAWLAFIKTLLVCERGHTDHYYQMLQSQLTVLAKYR